MIENGVKIFYMRNQRGQAAILVALMFNVLFIFFAMAINVALVVHDKINLQNSADLAAYYAASKQAELLNVIAHENYAIRQSYKLLAWRYRLLGTAGLYKNATEHHPVDTGETSDTVFEPAVKPALCVLYQPNWSNVPVDENLCNTVNLVIPALPQVSVIASFLPVNQAIATLSTNLIQQFNNDCDNRAATNWWFAMSILHAFRLDQRNRKQMIYALAKNLSGSANDFIDLDGNSVLKGAQETFVRNLTYANKQSFDAGGGNFALLNSLGGVDPTKWLPEVDIVPMIIYSDSANTGDSGDCRGVDEPVSTLPARPKARTLLGEPWPVGFEASDLEAEATDESGFLQNSDYQYSIGVEKNPWYMAYVGVKANSTPRQVFFPFGNGVPTVARSFAKPFGGRLGPWYKDTWQKGDSISSGTLVDALMAPRMEAGGLMNDPDDPTRLPNYSRYPADTLGMSSKLALNGLAGFRQIKLNTSMYKEIKFDMVNGSPNDILAWDFETNTPPPIRNYEILAIAPDLYDITYYSIEPDFMKNYFPKLVANRNALGIPSDTPIRTDLGQSPIQPTFAVQDQLAVQQTTPLQRPEAFYFVRNKTHLLTSWLPGAGAFNYAIDASMVNFGKCSLPDDGLLYTNPGSCVAGGGRTGYSVKLVGRDALLSDQHKIGGPNAAPGPILNPPANGW